MNEGKRVWVCLVKGRAHSNPTDPLEFFCVEMAGETVFMKEEHKMAGCGVYEKTEW